MTSKAFAEQRGEWIREKRTALGLSQAELAAAVETSDSAISSWERGDRVLSAFHDKRLRAFFKQRAADLAAKAVAQ